MFVCVHWFQILVAWYVCKFDNLYDDIWNWRFFMPFFWFYVHVFLSFYLCIKDGSIRGACVSCLCSLLKMVKFNRFRSIIILIFCFYKLEILSANFLVVVWNQEKTVLFITSLIFSLLRSHVLHTISCSYVCNTAEVEGLKRKLTSKLAANSTGLQPDWQVS